MLLLLIGVITITPSLYRATEVQIHHESNYRAKNSNKTNLVLPIPSDTGINSSVNHRRRQDTVNQKNCDNLNRH
jgi:hypothetical protein